MARPSARRRTRRWSRLCAALVLLAAARASAQGTSESVEDASSNAVREVTGGGATASVQETRGGEWLRGKHLTGDWGGLRPDARDAGFDYAFILGTMSQINFRGGANTHHAHETGGRALHVFELDFEKMGLIRGGSFFVRGLQSFNRGIQPDVGSLSAPYYLAGSSGDQEILLDKYWYRQRLFDDRLEFRLGKLLNFTDLFDKNAYADNYLDVFMSQALNYNQTMPPTLGLGAFVKLWPTDWFYAQAAAIDAETDTDYNRRGTGGWHSAFHDSGRFRGYWEMGLLPQYLLDDALPGKYALGWWYDGTSKAEFDSSASSPRKRSGDVGFYVNIEQQVWKENADAADKQGLGIFARYGLAHEEVNRISEFWSVGAVATGLLPQRDRDLLGFGVAQSILSGLYRREVNSLADRETVYELFYAIAVTPWLTITPDVQLITNPGGNRDARDALVGGLRVKLAF